MNKTNVISVNKNSHANLTLFSDTMKTFDSNTAMETIPKIVDAIKNGIEVFKKLERAYYKEKVKWRDDIIKHEKSLIEVMKLVKDPLNKKIIADGIIDFSQKILETAQEDLTASKSDNPFIKLMQYWIRKFDLDGKRKFWLETFDLQKDLLVSVLKSDIDKETEYKACKMMINYCDLLISGVDKLRYKSQNPKFVQEEYVSRFDGISELEIDRKILETKAIRDATANRIKNLRGYSDKDKTKVDAEKEKIKEKMLGKGISKSEKTLDLAK